MWRHFLRRGREKNTSLWDLGEIRWKFVSYRSRAAVLCFQCWNGGLEAQRGAVKRAVVFSGTWTQAAAAVSYRFVSVSLDQQVESPRAAAMAIFLPTRTPTHSRLPLARLAIRTRVPALRLVRPFCGSAISQSSRARRVCRSTIGKRTNALCIKAGWELSCALSR